MKLADSSKMGGTTSWRANVNRGIKPSPNTCCICHKLAILFAVAMLAALAHPIFATTYTWDSVVSGNWDNSVLWDPDGIPDDTADTATINAMGGAYTVSLNISPTLSNFTLDSADATLSAVSKTLTVEDSALLLDGNVLWQSSTWADDGAGTLNNSANMTVRGTSAINTNTFAQNGQLTIQGFYANHAALTVANGFTNSGTINLDSIDGAYQSRLNVTSGTLTNEGQININEGTGGVRTLGANLNNNNTVNINADTTFLKSSGSYTNNADLNIAADKTLTISLNNQTFSQNDGTLDVDGAFSMNSATFNFNGGTITGSELMIQNSSLNIGPGSTGAAGFSVRGGSSTLSGDIAPDQTVTVLGCLGGGHATLTAADGFTNSGVINLESIDSGYYSRFYVTSGTLTNEGQVNVNEGSGGTRTLSVGLANNGIVNISRTVALGKTGAAHTNSGDFSILELEAIVTVTGDTFINTAGGTISGIGALNISGVDFVNSGMVSPGLSPGILSITGDYVQSDTGILKIEIGGTVLGTDYDQLAIVGDAFLDGDLFVSAFEEFIPAPTDIFTILTVSGTGNTISGVFSNAIGTVNFIGGGTFDVLYDSTSVQLTNFVPEPYTLSILGLGGLIVLRKRKNSR
ncbi:MAG: PEP-CTERM sorting domain-containing protein [Phycisphaerae bacterium]|nr:PEP-CTERM sorting domain-containing protein [Phycisphaerae bacterium]MDD5381236.1 PEP-CTERM sorting domain-containing protein [Phycisphaerae bacterium]